MNPKRKFDIDNRRYFQFDASIQAVDGEDSTEFKISFASETPYKRWYGNEVLSHKAGDVNYDVLNSGGMFLFNHNSNDYLGTVKKAWSEGSKSYAIVNVSASSELAKQVLADIRNGTLKNISVGYEITNYEEIYNQIRKNDYDTNATYYVKWSPREVSIAPVPADPTVGFGRSIDIDDDAENFKPPLEKNNDNNQNEINLKTREVTQKMDVKTEDSQSLIKKEQERIASILEMSKKHHFDDNFVNHLIYKCDDNNTTKTMLDEISKKATIPQVATGDEIGMNQAEKSQYSLFNAINAYIKNDWRNAKLELEVSDEISKLMGGAKQGGFFFPLDLPVRNAGANALATSNLASAGTMINTTLLTGNMIDYIRVQSVVLSLGAKYITGLNGNIEIPKKTGSGGAYWVSEGEDVADGKLAYTRIGFSPKTLGIRHEITRLMLLQSSIDLEIMIREDIMQSIASEIDRVSLYGVGNTQKQPLGLFNNPDVTVIDAGSKIDVDTLIDMETALFETNLSGMSPKYLANSKNIGALKKLKTTTGEYLWSSNIDANLPDSVPGMINGYPIARSNQIKSDDTKNRIILGDFAQMMVLQWGALEIVPNQYGSTYASGGIEIRGMQTLDLGTRHPEAFVVAEATA